ncbi:glycosyltransferase family 1 protein [Lamprobacter modestohalophilus]|uniref:glycosyltransferase family 1 protein n=1 Tax=Lamprobacter modestohalophilus TaxID=1064514 RepID=UPI002ADEC4A0|nr:glycosyltransferase family 1 protein [Lamprobacter modestohalophilus]MEA1052137.1 glycosyltransferase family 1 protein [Lamprobacter modestohalophilus]
MNRLHPRLGKTVYLVEERPNPSTDYFVRPALQDAGYDICHARLDNPPDPALLRGASVVLVRYVSRTWAKYIARYRGDLAELIYFMDDDLFDPSASRGMPWRYRFKLGRLAHWRQTWLRAQGAKLWVSTRYLQQKYADWQPRLIAPMPLRAPKLPALSMGFDAGAGASASAQIRVFYHGSASHAAEIRWLYPVVAAALEAEPRLTFEIIGSAMVNRRYRQLPRTTIVHPMSWPTYQAFIAQPGRQIGLAPLLGHPFNRARACTKFFDITLAGAIGLYSPGPVCAELIKHDVNGWVVPLEPDDWTQAIIQLARDPAQRQRLLESAHSQGRSTIGI